VIPELDFAVGTLNGKTVLALDLVSRRL